MTDNVRFILDDKALRRWEERAPGAGDKLVGKLAYDVAADVIANFSPTSPSAPDTPPGVDTAIYKNNIDARRVQNGLWEVRFKRKYAIDLEYGTRNMAPRPHGRPALKRAAKRIGPLFKAIMED